MATLATKMMLFKNGKPLPLHLLRGSLLGGYNNNTTTTQFISDPAPLQPEQKPIFSLLGHQSNVGLGGGINRVLNWRSVGFGEMGRVYARGEGKIVISEEYEDDDDDDIEYLDDDYETIEYVDDDYGKIEDFDDEDDDDDEDDVR